MAKNNSFVLFSFEHREDAARALALAWIFYGITVVGYLAKQILIGFLPTTATINVAAVDLPPVTTLLSLVEFFIVTIFLLIIVSLMLPKQSAIRDTISKTQWYLSSWMLFTIAALGILNALAVGINGLYSWSVLVVSIVSGALGFVIKRFNR